MDDSQKLLFGEFPRLVGSPEQFPVFDEGSFDAFVEHSEGEANCYSRISWLANTGDWLLDRVFLDLDGHVSEPLTDTEVVGKLRRDEEFRQSVLGDVVTDVRTIAEFAREQSFPVVGVYTGKGVHVHLLTEPRRNPEQELRTNQKWLVDECELETFDRQVLGDVKRLSRVPNCRRYDPKVSDSTSLFTVPLSLEEMSGITAKELVEWSKSPRQIEEPGESRPPLFTREEYLESYDPTDVRSVEPVDVGEQSYDELTEQIEEWLKEVLQLPCMYERIVTRNPAHPVRFNVAIMLFNVGMTPEDVVEVYSRLGWHDYDPSITRQFAKQIYESGYADMSCASIQEKGLCVFQRDERSDECDAFGYPGGQQEW